MTTNGGNYDRTRRVFPAFFVGESMSKQMYRKRCRMCHVDFIAGRSDASLCSARCRKAASRIKECADAFCADNGIPFVVDDKTTACNDVGLDILEQGRKLTHLDAQIEMERFLQTFPLLQGWIVKMMRTQIVRKYCGFDG